MLCTTHMKYMYKRNGWTEPSYRKTLKSSFLSATKWVDGTSNSVITSHVSTTILPLCQRPFKKIRCIFVMYNTHELMHVVHAFYIYMSNFSKTSIYIINKRVGVYNWKLWLVYDNMEHYMQLDGVLRHLSQIL